MRNQQEPEEAALEVGPGLRVAPLAVPLEALELRRSAVVLPELRAQRTVRVLLRGRLSRRLV